MALGGGPMGPRLLPELLAGLTHGLIRAAHAVRCLSATEHPTELALQGLRAGSRFDAHVRRGGRSTSTRCPPRH